MGYTNYWHNKRAFTNDEWKKVKDEYEWLKEMAEGIIIDESKNNDEIQETGDEDILTINFHGKDIYWHTIGKG